MFNSGGRGGYERDSGNGHSGRGESGRGGRERGGEGGQSNGGSGGYGGRGFGKGRGGKKSMGDAESIRNLFEQVGRGGRGSLTIDDLCLSVIAPRLMEKIRDDYRRQD